MTSSPFDFLSQLSGCFQTFGLCGLLICGLFSMDVQAQVTRPISPKPLYESGQIVYPGSFELTETYDGGSTQPPELTSTQRLRQSLLIGGLTLSVGAYGFFALRYNAARAETEQAAIRYEEDVRLNAERYMEEGTNLEQIPAYRDWEDSYRKTVVSREWIARAGALTAILGLFTILDSATTGQNARAPSASVRPQVLIQPSVGTTHVLIGTRVRF